MQTQVRSTYLPVQDGRRDAPNFRPLGSDDRRNWNDLPVDRIPRAPASGWEGPSKTTSMNPGGASLLANESAYRPGYGPPPVRPSPTILSQYRNEFDRSQWQIREGGNPTNPLWKEARDPINPPLQSSFQRPNPQVQPAYADYPCQSDFEPKRCNREALTAAGRRMLNDAPCFAPQAPPPPGPINLCPQEVTWSAQWTGSSAMFIPVEDARCPNPECSPNRRWERIYRNPQTWNDEIYERGIQDGRLWNFYEHLDNRQKLLQFIASDFAETKGDPYTVPLSRPNPGVQTLAESRLAQRMPRPQF